MNIGQFKVGTEWKKLDEVTNFSYENNKDYTIQNKAYEPLLVCEGENAPEGDRIGFILQYGQSFGYTCKNGEFCWVRAYRNTTQLNVSEGI